MRAMASSAWITPFLMALRNTGVVSRAAHAAGISSSLAYTRRKEDADFAAAWDNAIEDATDMLEAEARRRAVEGIEEPVVYQGQLTPIYERDEHGEIVMAEYDTGARTDTGEPIMGRRPKQLVIDGKPQWLTVNKRSDALLQFLLKGLRARYSTERTEVTGKDGAPLPPQVVIATGVPRTTDVSDLA